MSYSREELKRVELDNFQVFLAHLWLFLQVKDSSGLSSRPTPVQLDIADFLQNGPKRCIIEAFRGVGKSWITVGFVLWTLLLDPQKQIMVVSAGEELAANFVKFCLQIIRSWALLQHLEPHHGQRCSSLSFDVGPATPKRDPSVVCKGITGQLTGGRADIIIADDVETPKNSQTQLLRDRLAFLVAEFDSILKPEKEARVIYLGTPQSENSLYNILCKDRGYTARIWPSEVPTNPDKYGKNGDGSDRLAPMIRRMCEQRVEPGTPTDPKRFTRSDLDERKLSNGAVGYLLQFMLDTVLGDMERYPLKLSDLVIHDCDKDMGPVKMVWGSRPETLIGTLQAMGFEGDRFHFPAWVSPEMAGYTGTVMAIDPAGALGKTANKDETGYAIVKYLHGRLYLVDVGGFKDGFSEETLSKLAGKALNHGVNDIIIEKNYGGGMFDKLFTPYLQRAYARAHKCGQCHACKTGQDGCEKAPGGSAGRIDDEWDGWSTGQKELRILDVLEPLVRQHKLVVDRRVIEQDLEDQKTLDKDYSFVYQFTRICRLRGALKHEDRLEAVAIACAYFVERMAKDDNKAMKMHNEALRDADLRKFMAAAHRMHNPGRFGNNRSIRGRRGW